MIFFEIFKLKPAPALHLNIPTKKENQKIMKQKIEDFVWHFIENDFHFLFCGNGLFKPK